MKKCKYCKSEIDEEAIICPVCKKNQNQKRNMNRIIIIIGVIFIIIIAYMIIQDRNDTIDRTGQIRENNSVSK